MKNEISLIEDLLSGRLRIPEKLKARLDAGEAANVQDSWGYTPLIAAARELGADAIAVLLAAGADHRATLRDGKNALHMAAMGQTRPDVILALIEAGIDPNEKDKQGSTPLHYAAAYAKNTEGNIVAALLEKGANPLAVDNDGSIAEDHAETPEAREILHAAAEKQALDKVAGSGNSDLEPWKGPRA
jgi:ankyrin repeat protein